jgi:hypothetical protein
MSEEIEQKLLRQIEQLQKEIKELKGINENNIPVFQFSKITHTILKELVNIKKNLDRTIFDQWFNQTYKIENETVSFFENLIEDNYKLIDTYSEEDLKINFLVPILNKVHFKSYEKEFREFYELPIKYETQKFIFNGTTDFVVSKGLVESEKPYFFIQEFKKGQQDGYPEPQLLAELISGIEINQWEEIKGAYIVGAFWYFVILNKIDNNKYEYFVSKSFDSMRIEDLKQIYKNLLYIKDDILKIVNS